MKSCSTIIQNEPELSKLHDFVLPIAKNSPVSNGGSKGAESLMKTVKKVLKPQQKMNDETVTQNTAAVRRDPLKLYRLNQALDLQASHALGHNKSVAKDKTDAPNISKSLSILGTIEAEDGFNEEEYSYKDVFDGDDDEDEPLAEQQPSNDEPVAAAGASKSVRSQLVIGSIVKARHPRWGDDWFHAEVRHIPQSGATGPGSKSCTLRWLDETGGEGSGIFEYEMRKPWDKEESIALAKVVSPAAELHGHLGLDGQRQWLTEEAFAAQLASAACSSASTRRDTSSAAAAPASTSSSTPFSRVVLTAEPAPIDLRQSSSAVDLRQSFAAAIDLTQSPASDSKAAGSTRDDAIDIDPDQVVLHSHKSNKKRMISSSCLLSSDPAEWLNDSQINAAASLIEMPVAHRIKFNYPRGPNVETVFKSRLFQRALTGDINPPLAAIGQNYVSQAHWRKLIVCFAEKLVYYFEPVGSRLRSGPIIDLFNDVLNSLNDGWRFQSIEVRLQTDGCSCGLWQLVADRAFAAYVDSSEFGTGRFGLFLVGWLAMQRPQP
eukprot:2695074-Prymnesium_polylepis.1